MYSNKFIKFVYEEFIYGGHLLSFSAIGVILISVLVLNIKISWEFLTIAYLGAQSFYLFNLYKEFNEDFLTNPERTKHVEKYLKYIPYIIFILLIIILTIGYFKKIQIQILGFIFLVIIGGLIYTKYLKRFTQKIPAFKNFFASIIGALLVLLPVIYYSHPIDLSVYLLMFFLFLKWFVTTSFLDVKDIAEDKKYGLLTLPIILTKNKLFNLLTLITILSLLPISIGVYFNLFPKFSLLFILTLPYTLYYLIKLKSKITNDVFLNYIFVDGEYIAWPIFIFLIKLIYV